jgi:hypothetical protein
MPEKFAGLNLPRQHQSDITHGRPGSAFGLPALFDRAAHALGEARDGAVNNGVLLL